jgi:hypothetical protein
MPLFDNAADQFTIAMWVNPDNLAASPHQMFFDKLDESSAWGISFCAWYESRTISLTLKSDGWLQVGGSTPIADNTWTFIAATYDGSKSAAGVKLYVNGIAEQTFIYQDYLSTEYMSNTIAAQIGAREGANYPFDGSIDEVMLFNTTLTPADIINLYQQGL